MPCSVDSPRGCASGRSASVKSGQSTAEYALVILGAAAIATLLITWATGSHAITKLFDTVIDKVLPS